jgi:hypothetical protein
MNLFQLVRGTDSAIAIEIGTAIPLTANIVGMRQVSANASSLHRRLQVYSEIIFVRSQTRILSLNRAYESCAIRITRAEWLVQTKSRLKSFSGLTPADCSICFRLSIRGSMVSAKEICCEYQRLSRQL